MALWGVVKSSWAVMDKDIQQFGNVVDFFFFVWDSSNKTEHRLLLWLSSVQVPGKMLLGNLDADRKKDLEFCPNPSTGDGWCNTLGAGISNSSPAHSEIW